MNLSISLACREQDVSQYVAEFSQHMSKLTWILVICIVWPQQMFLAEGGAWPLVSWVP